MEITDKRILNLIEKFSKALVKQVTDDLLEYIDYPGGIVWITEKQARLNKGLKDTAVAYIKKIKEHGSTPGQTDIPIFKIVLIKERVLQLSNKEFLYLLAHELSHIFFKVGKKPHNFEDCACDTLAEHFFDFPKPKGSTLGYMYDEEGFRKIYGTKLPKK